MGSAIGDFSNLRVRRGLQSVGMNYRLSETLVWSSTVEYNHYRDSEPYLYTDTTGRFFTFRSGFNLLF